jgi:hypothetical protein
MMGPPAQSGVPGASKRNTNFGGVRDEDL